MGPHVQPLLERRLEAPRANGMRLGAEPVTRQDKASAPAQSPPPPKYFAFASPSDDVPLHANGLALSEVKTIIAQHGSNVMLGFDRGAFSDADLTAMQQGRIDDVGNAALKYALQRGARLHVYVEGPGGATGSAWSADEKARIRAAARSVGITIRDPSDPRDHGGQAWRDHGWSAYTRRQLAELKKAGFESVEIDNLDSATRIGNDPQGTLAFFLTYAQWWTDGEVPRLLPKNLVEGQATIVVTAVTERDLPRGMFSDFAIAERGVGKDRDAQARTLARIGIQLIKSNDTDNYDAFGAYRLYSTPRYSAASWRGPSARVRRCGGRRSAPRRAGR